MSVGSESSSDIGPLIFLCFFSFQQSEPSMHLQESIITDSINTFKCRALSTFKDDHFHLPHFTGLRAWRGEGTWPHGLSADKPDLPTSLPQSGSCFHRVRTFHFINGSHEANHGETVWINYHKMLCELYWEENHQAAPWEDQSVHRVTLYVP